MKNESKFVKTLRLMSPVFPFLLLVLPYSLLNSYVIVEIFGCGCPTIATDGTVSHALFNANHFTACFWFAVAVGAVLLAFFQSKRIMVNRVPQRVLYITGIATMSLTLMLCLNRLMMWC